MIFLLPNNYNNNSLHTNIKINIINYCFKQKDHYFHHYDKPYPKSMNNQLKPPQTNIRKHALVQNPQQVNSKRFSMQQLLQQYNKIDTRKQGSIKLPQATRLIKRYLNKILDLKQQLHIKNLQDQINFDDIFTRIIFNHQNQVTFDQFLAILYEVEIDIEIHNNLVNQNMVDFLHLLEDYRKKCQDASEYLQAEKAHQKIIEIKDKEMKRHKQKFLYQQKSKVSSVNSLQQSKILQFNSAWNDYMQKYQQAAINSIEKLKAKHLRQMQEQQQRIRSYYQNYMKPSKKVIDLKSKQKNLVKQRQYQQAQRLKQYVNRLNSKQRQSKTEQINQRIKKRKQTLQKHQQIALLAHLKRIQKDRNQQMKQRQNDSSKMLIKLRNIQNDLVQKQSVQIRQTLDNLRQTMCLTSSQLFGKRKMRSLGKLQSPGVLNQSHTKIINNQKQKQKQTKQKTSFKIRVNSFHRVKMDHSLYDP